VKEDEIQQIKLEAMRVNKIRENTLNKLKIVVGQCWLTHAESAWN
jgi:hypothetical protein